MEPLISVIIPVYNLEHELAACLASVQAQTVSDWEAVCVDDGSADGSLDVLRAVSTQDARIRVLHQENAGVSAARNMGLANAKGTYVYFLDGDDILHPQTFELLSRCMQDGGYDVVVSSYQRIRDQHAAFAPIPPVACRDVSYAEYFQLDSSVVRSSCLRLYRREIAQKARFSEAYSHGEDTHFVYQILALHVRIGFLDAPLYGYYDRQTSASRQLFNESNVTAVLAFRDVCDTLQNGTDELLFGMAMKMLLQEILLVRMHLSNNKRVVKICRQSGCAYLAAWLRCKAIPLRTRIEYAVFFSCPFFYALARICTDPTMLDFYLKKRKKNQESIS